MPAPWQVVRLSDGKHYLFLPPAPDPDDPPDLSTTRLMLRAATQPYFRISTFTSDIPEVHVVRLFTFQGSVLPSNRKWEYI